MSILRPNVSAIDIMTGGNVFLYIFPQLTLKVKYRSSRHKHG
jgi:hypothetical protein